VQLGLLQLQHHRGERRVHRAVAGPRTPVGERLGRRAVQQDRDVHAVQVRRVAVRPLQHDDADVADVDPLVPELPGLSPHPLEHEEIGPGVEVLQDRVHLVESDLRRRAEVGVQGLPPAGLVGRQPGIPRHRRGIGVAPVRLQTGQGGPDVVVVAAGRDQRHQSGGAERAQPFGVVVGGDSARVVVARQDVRADAGPREPVSEQRADLGLADPRSAADRDDDAASGRQLLLEQTPQDGERRPCLREVRITDPDAVAGHVTRGNLAQVDRLREGHVHVCSSPEKRLNSWRQP